MGPPAVTMACLLLGFLLPTKLGADAQALGLNESLFSEVTVKRYQAQAGQMQLTCQVSSPGRFKAWVKDNFVVGMTAILTLSASDPNKYGSYFCVADPEISPNRYRALQFVITEMPPNERTTEVSAALNRDVSLTCQLSSRSGSIKWYKYNDATFKFEEIRGQTGVQLVLSYPQLSREHGSGFTYYKCADPADASISYQAFKVVKDPVQQMIDGRMTNVYEQSMRALPTDVASVSVSVTPKSKVAFECHKVTPSDSTQWYFRDNKTVSANRYSDLSGQGGVEIQDNPDSSVLSVKNCDVKNKGYYRCVVGGTVKYAFLDIRVIVPTIQEYGKTSYDLTRSSGADNELECEIPIGGELNDVIWRIVPSDGSTPFDIPVNRNSSGFETSVNNSGSIQLVTIKFRDNPRFNNYRLECRLGDELDYVTLRSAQPMQISIKVGPAPYPGITYLNCTSDPRLRDVKFHINNEKNDPISAPGIHHHKQISDALHLYYHRSNRPNHWYRCSGVDPSTNTRKYSEPVPLVKDPLTLDIKIDGSLVSPKTGTPSMAKVVGQRTEFVCNFTNYKDLGIRPENVKLMYEGTLTSYRAVQLGAGTFRFVFDSPTRSNSGRYFCIHDVRNQGQRVRSSEVTINWCETNQFMCDNRCRDRSIVCNGVTECADRSDEHPALCSPCEPNEVPCQDWKGARPAKNCVLKHWLCDGTDDCENGYDEESPLSKKWCKFHRIRWNFTQWTDRAAQISFGVSLEPKPSDSVLSRMSVQCRLRDDCQKNYPLTNNNVVHTSALNDFRFRLPATLNVSACIKEVSCEFSGAGLAKMQRSFVPASADPEHLKIELIQPELWPLTGVIQFRAVSENACPSVRHRCQLHTSNNDSLYVSRIKQFVSKPSLPECLSSAVTQFAIVAQPSVIAGATIKCRLLNGNSLLLELPQLNAGARLAGVWERPLLAASSTIAVLAIIALTAVACLFDLRTIRWRYWWETRLAAVVGQEAVKLHPTSNQHVHFDDDATGVNVT